MAETLQSFAKFTAADPKDYVDFWLVKFEEHGYDYCHPDPWRLEMVSPYFTGSMTLNGRNVTVEINCNTLDMLYAVRGAISHHLEEFDPKLIDVRWDGVNTEGEMPPNFKLAKVIGAQAISKGFIRVVIQGDDLGRFGENGLHFRLVRPLNPDRPPIWPVMGSNGVAQWPKGEHTLIDRVYTIRYFDAENGKLTFDVFHHKDGFTCEWAKTNPVGQIVGVMGPGGGWFPPSDNLFLAGDETALPAIARIIEYMPKAATGTALILVPNLSEKLTLDAPADFDVQWLIRGEDNLLTSTKKSSQAGFDFYWFAAHKDEARAMRMFWQEEKQIDRKAMQVVAYWS